MSGLSLVAAASFAFGTGVTTFFAPCAYPLLPGYVGYYMRSADDGARSPVVGALARGVAASTGILLTFALLAGLTVTVGQSLAGYLSSLEVVVGLVLVGLGLLTLSGRTTGWHVRLPARRTSVFGFVGFGVLYAVAATGCLAPVFLGIVSQALAFPLYGTLTVLGAYAAGMVLLMIAATVAVAVGLDAGGDWLPAASVRASQVAGLIILMAGLAQVFLALFVYT